MTCPFSVGDRIHERQSVWTYAADPDEAALVEPEWELDPTKPDATVTALTTRGFEYTYDHRIPVGRAPEGTWTDGGECYPEGYHLWVKVSP